MGLEVFCLFWLFLFFFYYNLSKTWIVCKWRIKGLISHALVTSDSDFRHLVFKLLDLGREVLGFGESKGNNDFAGIFTTFAKST